MDKLSVDHLLGIKYLKKSDINLIFKTAIHFKEVINRPIKKVPTLRDLTIANLFFENSTRTKISFELAQKRLGAEVVNFSTSMDAGAIVRPGSVIAVNDPVRQGDRRSGRIAAATTTQITVDDTTNLESFGGSNKECSVIMPDGTVEKKSCTVVGDKRFN